MASVASKRKRDNITLGSGYPYIIPYSTSFPDKLSAVKALCTDEHRLGYIKGGASLEYSQETYEEKDDFGIVRKVITTDEAAVLKMGLITWNGETLKNLIDRCSVEETTESSLEEDTGKVRVTKIGGIGNAQGGYYILIFHHVDKTDGDVYLVLVGKNTAGATLSFSTESGTLVEPEFTAIPADKDGTLVYMYEEMGKEAV